MAEPTLRKHPRPLTIGIAALTTVGLVFSGASAAAASATWIDNDDIAGFENGDETSTAYNYDQWHVGSVYNDELTSDASVTVHADGGIEFLAVPADSGTEATITQVMKGYPAGSRPASPAAIIAALESIEIDVESGSVTLQLPLFDQEQYVDAESGEVLDIDTTWLGTFSNSTAFGPGIHQLEADTTLTNSLGTVPYLGDVATIGDLFDALIEDYDGAEGFFWPELLGIGFTGEPGTVVNSITFDGVTYHFGAAPAQDGDDSAAEQPAPETPTPSAPVPPVSVETSVL